MLDDLSRKERDYLPNHWFSRFVVGDLVDAAGSVRIVMRSKWRCVNSPRKRLWVENSQN